MTLCCGCSAAPSTSRHAQGARRAAERFLSALAAHDFAVARRESSCRLPDSAAFQGATILRAYPPALVAASTLDSLADAAEDSMERAARELAAAGEETADSLWLRSEEARRRTELWRDARVAAAMARDRGRSMGAEAAAATGSLQFCRMRVRIRWGGPRVGPEPVDREHVLRALAAPGGRWIVFSLLPRDRDPSGDPF